MAADAQIERKGLMTGKRGLVMGVANERSLAWGLAMALVEAGAEVILSSQNEALDRRVAPLATRLGCAPLERCDVTQDGAIESLVTRSAARMGGLDFVVHALAFADRRGLGPEYITIGADAQGRADFRQALLISCYSFTAVCRAAAKVLPAGGALLTLSYQGSQRVVPGYNLMGVAKAALEASVRYLAADLGPQGLRVNALSPGPMRTLSASAVRAGSHIYAWCAEQAALQRNVTLSEVGNAGLYLLSPLSLGVTGEVLYVDGGSNTIGVPRPVSAAKPNAEPQAEPQAGPQAGPQAHSKDPSPIGQRAQL